MALSQSCLPFKSKGHPMKSLCRHIGGEGIAQTCLQSISSKVWVVSITLRPPYPWERLGTHCTGGWVDLGASMDAWKILLSLDFGSRTAQPVTSRYTNCIIPATQPCVYPIIFLHVAYSCTPKMEDHSFHQNVGTYLPKCMAYYIPQDHNLNIICFI